MPRDDHIPVVRDVIWTVGVQNRDAAGLKCFAEPEAVRRQRPGWARNDLGLLHSVVILFLRDSLHKSFSSYQQPIRNAPESIAALLAALVVNLPSKEPIQGPRRILNSCQQYSRIWMVALD